MGGTTAASWFLHTLGGGGLLLLVGWVLTAWTRQPARRLRVAEWAMTASLLLAFLSLGPTWLVLCIPGPGPISAVPASSAIESSPAPREESAAAAAAFIPPPPVFAPLAIQPEPSPFAPVPALPESEPAPAVVSAAPARTAASFCQWDGDRIAALAMMLYLVCGATILCRWLLGWIALQRLLWRSEPVRGREARLFAEMAGPSSHARLLASRQTRAPFSCGLLQPTVVLPAGLCETTSDEMLRWVFAHELAHLERRDAWSSLLFGLGQALYFGVPWFWGLRRQARLCQEYLADAAAAGGRPEDYAQFLLAWAAAPRAPIGACGLWGHSSDLFWRIKTMLQNRVSLERRCPRRWSMAAACGLLSLAVLTAGLTLKATAAPAPEPKDEPKKEAPKADAPAPAQALPDLALPNIEEALRNLPPNLDPEQAKQLRRQMELARDQMKRMLELQRRNGLGAGLAFSPFAPGGPQPQNARLGAEVERPSDTLVEQLDLPKDQGLIIRDVTPDSAAAKAGLKPHDILLEVNGKAVSSDPEEFRKALADVKPDTPVDAVVMRKGKKETIKGLSMPEAKETGPGFPGLVVPVLPPNFPNVNLPNPIVPPLIVNPVNPNINFPNPIVPPLIPNGAGVMTTMFRSNDHFTTRHQEGSLIITLTGKTADGKATVNEISVQDGAESNKYDSLDKVPEKYQDKVKNLVEMSEKGSVKVEINAP